MSPHHLRDEWCLGITHMGPNDSGVPVVFQGTLQLSAKLVLYVDVYWDAVACREVIDSQCDGSVRWVVIAFWRRVAEGAMPKGELPNPIHPSGVKLSPEEVHRASVQQQFLSRWVPLYLGEWEYVVRILLLDGLDVRNPSKEHAAANSSFHQSRKQFLRRDTTGDEMRVGVNERQGLGERFGRGAPRRCRSKRWSRNWRRAWAGSGSQSRGGGKAGCRNGSRRGSSSPTEEDMAVPVGVGIAVAAGPGPTQAARSSTVIEATATAQARDIRMW